MGKVMESPEVIEGHAEGLDELIEQRIVSVGSA